MGDPRPTPQGLQQRDVIGEEKSAIETRLEEMYREYKYSQDEELNHYGNEGFDRDIVAWYDDHLRRNPYRWDDIYKAAFVMETLSAFCQGYKGGQLAGKLIDIGCGSGCTLSVIESDRRYADKLQMSGIDFSAQGIAIAQERTEKVDLVVGDFLQHDFGQRFDIALSLGVFEHFPNLYAAFKKTFEILADDGLAYIEVPDFDSKARKRAEAFGRHQRGKQLMWLLDKESYIEVIKSVGFTILRDLQYIHPHNHFTWILAKPDSQWVETSPESSRHMRALYFKYYIRPRVAKILPAFVKAGLKRVIADAGLTGAFKEPIK